MPEFHDDVGCCADCECDDYDLDILIGRATCSGCGRRWYMSADEIEQHQKLLFQEPQ